MNRAIGAAVLGVGIVAGFFGPSVTNVVSAAFNDSSASVSAEDGLQLLRKPHKIETPPINTLPAASVTTVHLTAFRSPLPTDAGNTPQPPSPSRGDKTPYTVNNPTRFEPRPHRANQPPPP
jgi:hypothetical protein